MHGGTLSGLPPVNACLRDPKLSQVWGVERSAIIIATDARGRSIEIEEALLRFDIGGVDFEIYRHPMFFINEDVKAWYNRYSVLEYAKSLEYEESYLWFDALNVYKTAYSKYLQK